MSSTCASPTCAAPGSKRCSGCKATHYCSTSCQKQDWRHHKPTCKSSTSTPSAKAPASTDEENIQAVMIHSRGEGGRYSPYPIPRSHAIFQTPAVPISQKIGFPLLVQRADKTAERGANADNQHATWLQIDPVSGFAPPEWQGGIGNAIVARADGRALDTGTLAAVTDYVSDILDAFGDGVEAARSFYDGGRLKRYFREHRKMQEEFKAFRG